MKSSLRVIALVLVVLFVAAGHAVAWAQPVLRVTGPSIVILTDTQAEYERLLREEEQHGYESGYSQFTDDFLVYTNRMVKALQSHTEIAIRWSHASTVAFPGTRYKPIRRKRLGGWGYVFFRPGAKPIVIHEVETDDDLVCTAAKLYALKVEGYTCAELGR